jgi:hypothetical protein
VSALQITSRAVVALVAAAGLHANAQEQPASGAAAAPAVAASPAAGKADAKNVPPVAPAASASGASAAVDRKPGAPVRIGIDQPVAVVPATSDETTVRVLLRDTSEPPSPEDLSAGLLTSTTQTAAYLAGQRAKWSTLLDPKESVGVFWSNDRSTLEGIVRRFHRGNQSLATEVVLRWEPATGTGSQVQGALAQSRVTPAD